MHGMAKDKGLLEHNDRGSDTSDINLLVGYRGEMYYMAANFSFELVTRDFFAIGSGRDEASGVLYCLRHGRPGARIEAALDACAELLCDIDRPFTYEVLLADKACTPAH